MVHFFTMDIIKGKTIDVFQIRKGNEVARDFTCIDHVVNKCLGALNMAEKSIGSGGNKQGKAQLRDYNLENTSPVPVATLKGSLKVKAKKHVDWDGKWGWREEEAREKVNCI